MKIFFKIFFLCSIAILYNFSSSAQLSVTSVANAQTLVQRLVGNGILVSNVSLTAAPVSTGFFNNISGTSIGIDSGIVLTSGRAKTNGLFGLDGNGFTPASNALADQDNGMPGDRDIANLVGVQLADTYDACILEFDFVPLGDSIKFNYVFSSEEYTPLFVCNFNDAFAFFISGPGITGIKNIALIPNTNTPVSIFNVNDVNGGGCPNNPAYFVDNTSNTFFTHDGHTRVFTALSEVQPCQTYHLKLVIADVGDGLFDSGVFLQAKSLSSNVISIHNSTQVDPQNNNYLVEGCAVGSFRITRPQADASPLSIALQYSGTATNGIDMQALPTLVTIPANQTEVVIDVLPVIDNIPEGIETIKIYALAGCGNGLPTDSTSIQIRDYDTLGINPDTAGICKNMSIQIAATAGYTSYQWDPNPTLNNTAIRNPVASPLAGTTIYYCTATEGTCHGRDSSLIWWKDLNFISKKEIYCKNDASGEIRVSGGPEWTGTAEYSINNGPWQADSTFLNLPVGVYTIRARDITGCMDSLVISITQLFPDLLITGIPITPATCSGNSDGIANINVTGGGIPYLFSSDGINFQSNNIITLAQGNYTITVKDNNGCTDSRNIVVPLNNIVTLEAGADKMICESKTVQLDAVSNADSFVWTPAGSLSNSSIHNPVASPLQTTLYHITATTGVCSKTDSVTVFVNPAPVANAGPDQSICYGQNVQLMGSGGDFYRWVPSSYLDDFRSATPTAVQLPGSAVYALRVTNIYGCLSLNTDTMTITVTRPALVYVGRDTTLATGQQMPMFAADVNNIGFIEYEWSPKEGLNNPFIANPVATAQKDISYTVTARNARGCTATDYLKIRVLNGPDIYVPNAFSPNGDRLNDFLKAIPAGIRDFHYFRIFDRWGRIVFNTTNYLNGWDGKLKGNAQVNGTYVWMAEGVDYRGNTVQRKGTVTIVK